MNYQQIDNFEKMYLQNQYGSVFSEKLKFNMVPTLILQNNLMMIMKRTFRYLEIP
jgi:hypothetical protein